MVLSRSLRVSRTASKSGGPVVRSAAMTSPLRRRCRIPARRQRDVLLTGRRLAVHLRVEIRRDGDARTSATARRPHRCRLGPSCRAGRRIHQGPAVGRRSPSADPGCRHRLVHHRLARRTWRREFGSRRWRESAAWSLTSTSESVQLFDPATHVGLAPGQRGAQRGGDVLDLTNTTTVERRRVAPSTCSLDGYTPADDAG